MTGPLSHIRVLDLSRVLAGPWAGQVLADLGADVIKVERPESGDDTRAWGPPFLKDADGKPGDAGYFLAVNRGKRSVAVDLSTTEGQEVVKALAAQSDIVLENFKAGTLQRYGLDYESLSQVKPDLIYCSITGFGQTGPRKADAAYDFMIQAMGGLMSVTGEADGKPGGGPQKVGVPIVDLMTGMYAAIACLAALARRAHTGRGDYVDIAMLDVQVSFLLNQAMNFLISGKPPRRSGNAHPNIQPQDVFPCQDGHIVLAVGNDGQFSKLCEVLGQPDLAADARFAKNAGRIANQAELSAILLAALATWPMTDLLQRLADAGVPSGPINTIPRVFEDPQVKHREMVVKVAHPLAPELPQIASPMRFSEAPVTYRRHPPLLGEHTREVLQELGIDMPAEAGAAEPHHATASR
uniref:CoA transferase n=1 Tax=Bosea sp. NBC_00436 TaxID=2969620 RepID=A0A9E7ZIX4_9HYPH